MHCPDCLRQMYAITLGTQPPMILDSCHFCGGTWADQSETNFVSLNALTDVGIVPQLLHAVSPPASRICPKDKTILTRFRSESIPEHVEIFHCTLCGGSWFPKGSIVQFKKAQEAKISFLKLWRIPLASAYAVLLPVLLVVVITGGMIVTVQSIQEKQTLQSQAGSQMSTPVVRSVSQTSVHISFTTIRPQKTSLLVWPTTDQTAIRTVPVDTQPTIVHTVKLTNLTPATNYSYRVILTSVAIIQSQVYSFATISY